MDAWKPSVGHIIFVGVGYYKYYTVVQAQEGMLGVFRELSSN